MTPPMRLGTFVPSHLPHLICCSGTALLSKDVSRGILILIKGKMPGSNVWYYANECTIQARKPAHVFSP